MTSYNNSSTFGNHTGLPGLEPHQILKISFGSLSILLNGFLLLVIVVERKKLLVSRISYLVTNLALADFLIGGVLVFIIQPIELRERKPKIDDLQLPFIWTALLMSLCTVFLMSAERFVMAALPMVWSNILTINRTIVGICIIWCLAIISGVMVYYYRFKTLFAFTITMEVFIVVIIAIHLYIFRFLKTRQTQAEVNDNEGMEASPWPTTERTSHTTSSAKQRGEVTTVVVILLVVLILTIFPHFICLQIALVYAVYEKTFENMDWRKFSEIYEYTDTLFYLNFVVNPIIYAWRLTMYRKAFTKLLQSCSLFLRNLYHYLLN